MLWMSPFGQMNHIHDCHSFLGAIFQPWKKTLYIPPAPPPHPPEKNPNPLLDSVSILFSGTMFSKLKLADATPNLYC